MFFSSVVPNVYMALAPIVEPINIADKRADNGVDNGLLLRNEVNKLAIKAEGNVFDIFDWKISIRFNCLIYVFCF